MMLRTSLLATVLVAALAACGQGPETATQTPAATAAAPDEAPADAGACTFTLASNDAMQYDASEIVVGKDCTQFTIELRHTGKMPVGAMGHNVVITHEADMAAVAADAIAAGAAAGFLKAEDARVIAASSLIGGGESTSVTFPVEKLADDGPLVFFCSFPGHSTMMKGSLRLAS